MSRQPKRSPSAGSGYEKGRPGSRGGPDAMNELRSYDCTHRSSQSSAAAWASLVEDGRPRPGLEGGDVERLLGAQRVADHAEPLAVYPWPGCQPVQRSLRVPQHLRHPAPGRPPLLQARDRLVEGATLVAVDVVARADGCIAAPREVEADVIPLRPFEPRRLPHVERRGRVQHEHAGPGPR